MRTLLTICLLMLASAAYCQEAPKDPTRDSLVAAAVKTYVEKAQHQKIDNTDVLVTVKMNKKQVFGIMEHCPTLPQNLRDKAEAQWPTADTVIHDQYFAMVYVHYAGDNTQAGYNIDYAFLTRDLQLIFAGPSQLK